MKIKNSSSFNQRSFCLKKKASILFVVVLKLSIGLGFSPLSAAKEATNSSNDQTKVSHAIATADIETAARCQNKSGSFLWQVENKKNTASSVYLFGSIHLGARNFYPLHSTIEKAFHSSDHLVFEVDPRSAQEPAIMFEVQSRSLLPNNETIDQHISEETFLEVKKALTDFGLPVEPFLSYKPWFLTMLLTNSQYGSMGYMPIYGVEQYLLNQKNENVDVLELESLLEQLALLESFNDEDFLKYTLNDLNIMKRVINQLLLAWKCGDTTQLAKIFASSYEGVDKELKNKFEALQKQLFDDRNHKMTEGIDKLLREGNGTYFVVVGAGHYVGNDNIIELLEKKGYEINNISLAPANATNN